jgi:transposase
MIMKVNDTRTLSPDAQEQLRRRVVAAIRDGGMTRAQAARAFRVSRTSINAWLDAYAARGSAALRSGKRGRKPVSRLKPHQAATVVRMIQDRCPDQLKLPFALWTREAVCKLLAERFGLSVSVWTAGRYLRAWGFTPQKPVRRAYERDPAAVKRWLEQDYPAIARRAKREKALIHWGDEMGLRSDHQTGTSYGRRGQTPVVTGTGRRFGCNMISALTNQGQLSFMIFRERFTARVFIRFAGRLLRQPYLAGRKCFLIVDGHPVHKSAAVKRWLAQRAERIEMFLLPGYSPELNPDELLNQDVKSNALGRQRPADQKEMMHLARTYLRSTQRRPEMVCRYFHEEHVRYAADPDLFNYYCPG